MFQVAAKSVFETGDRTGGLNQTITSCPLDPAQSPLPTGPSVGVGAAAVTTPENAAKKFEDDDTWRAKFLLKVQVKIIVEFRSSTFATDCWFKLECYATPWKL